MGGEARRGEAEGIFARDLGFTFSCSGVFLGRTLNWGGCGRHILL